MSRFCGLLSANSNSCERSFDIVQPPGFENIKRQPSAALHYSSDKQDYIQRWLCDVFVAVNCEGPKLPPHGRDHDGGEPPHVKAANGPNNKGTTAGSVRPCSSTRPPDFDVHLNTTGSSSGAAAAGEEDGWCRGRHNCRCNSLASSSLFVREETTWQAKGPRRKTHEGRYNRHKQQLRSKRNNPTSRQKARCQRLSNQELRKNIAERFQSNHIANTVITVRCFDQESLCRSL